MGLRIQIPGLVVQNPVGFNPPVGRGLNGLFFFTGGDGAAALRNLALDASDPRYAGTLVGTPTFAADGVITTQGAHYIDTLVPDSVLGTTIMVARNEDTPSSVIVPFATCWSDDPGDAYSGNVGESLMQRAAGSITTTIGIVGTGGPPAVAQGRADLAVADMLAWHIYAGGYDGTGRWVQDLTTPGNPKTYSASTAKLPNAVRTWLVGSSAAGVTGAGRGRVAAFVRHDVALTDEELATWCAFCRAHPRMAALGAF
ncbi:hypothetical protein [Ketogulonicigenium vulgare]|uniref:hypothetical protein n=1 Tax=Ketogulonicigenium vulgare TaxID=92945 RepID=UPI002359407B|nr:hypothetical protein [Ketogulonicigenium vulgare]